jgi:hypothetical protein
MKNDGQNQGKIIHSELVSSDGTPGSAQGKRIWIPSSEIILLRLKIYTYSMNIERSTLNVFSVIHCSIQIQRSQRLGDKGFSDKVSESAILTPETCLPSLAWKTKGEHLKHFQMNSKYRYYQCVCPDGR